MSRCCPDCIGDAFLRREVFPVLGKGAGPCEFCGADAELLVEAMQLQDHFERLLGAYEVASTGRGLVELLACDWGLFAHSRLSSDVASRLLAAVLGDDTFANSRYVPKTPQEVGLLLQWQEFRSELMHRNRFFPKRRPNLKRMKELLAYLLAPPDECPKVMFRARILDGERPYLPAQMGAPPAEVATHGRANPVGIPYLYLASDTQTAVSELRPHVGDRACVAAFTLPGKLKLVDLRDPKRTASPFAMADEGKIALLRRDLAFLAQLGQELSRPVGSHSAPIQYLPSQYLCEFIKRCRFDGVMYKSSVGPGVNVAVFNPGIAGVGAVRQYSVSEVSVRAVPVRGATSDSDVCAEDK